MRDYKMPWVQW